MKKLLIIAAVAFASVAAISPQGKVGGYKVGDKASDFKLKNINGKFVSMADYKDAKGFIVIFTCNHCPFAMAYENRIMALDSKFTAKGYPVIAINPNDPAVAPDDSYEKMQERAKEKGFKHPYLWDDTQEIAKMYGASRTPHVFVLTKKDKKLKVAYIGAIDDNYEDESAVKSRYTENAVNALLEGKNPNPDFTRSVGCTIKWKK
jgi:peroxiredoxin